MADETSEAERLAAQRTGDLADAQQRALKLAEQTGFERAENEQFKRETREHSKAVNGSIEKHAKAMEALTKEVRAIREEQAARDAVNIALIKSGESAGAKKLSQIQKAALIIGALVGIATFALAVVQAIGHS